MRDVEYVRSLPVGIRHLADNIAIPAIDPAALRVKRHILLSGCQDIAYPFWAEKTDKATGEISKKTEFRVSICGHQPIDDQVALYRNGQTVGYSGIMRCGNVWSCPICCAKVMRRRGEQIHQLFESVHSQAGSAVMITFTSGHKITDPLNTLLDRFKAAKRSLTQSKGYRHIATARTGAVSATEITYSNKSGWHPHQHDVWFFDSGVEINPDELADSLFSLWDVACKKHALTTLASFKGRRIGVDVRPSWNASDYLAKFDRERDWSLAAEMTAGRLKMAQGQSMTPWSLLEDSIIRGADSPAAKLWVEYMRATRGKSVISLMPARKLLLKHNLPTRADDFADANKVGDGEVIGHVSAAEYDRICRGGGLGSYLEAARNSGLLRSFK